MNDNNSELEEHKASRKPKPTKAPPTVESDMAVHPTPTPNPIPDPIPDPPDDQ